MPKTATPAGAPERITVQCRTTARLRERLEQAALESGRSLSQEMEMRLEQSLFREDAATYISNEVTGHIYSILSKFGNPVTRSLLEDLAQVIGCVENHIDGDWYASAENKAFLHKSLEAILPAAIRSYNSEKDATGDALFRSLDLINRLPFRPKPRPSMPAPEGMRFVTEEEHKRFFYLNDDNADPPDSEAAKKRQRSVRVPLKKG